ncbi:MAG: hypothetical protein JW847_00425 [Candidatus Omnitrophica bacterium]|nr:hypothetical protein [Candidatus Omnitrophota bacterium]
MNVDISVIICTRNRCESLKEALKKALALPNDAAGRMAEEARRSILGRFNIEIGAREVLEKLGIAYIPRPSIEENKEK